MLLYACLGRNWTLRNRVRKAKDSRGKAVRRSKGTVLSELSLFFSHLSQLARTFQDIEYIFKRIEFACIRLGHGSIIHIVHDEPIWI